MSNERAQAGVSPMQPEVRLHVRGMGAKLPETFHVPVYRMFLYSGEFIGCRHSFRKCGIDCQSAATTATATTMDLFPLREIVANPPFSKKVKKCVLLTNLSDKFLPHLRFNRIGNHNGIINGNGTCGQAWRYR